MAVCNFPQTSPPIGQASTSCLRKFTIHFRRPEKLKQKKGATYKGEYGFDWLRDEYIYPIEEVLYDNCSDSESPIPINDYRALCLKSDQLKLEYLQVGIADPIQPHGQDYYPAWLSIFASKVKGDNADKGSDMHKDGVYLDLQLDEIDKIINDGTEIFFKPSEPCLKITPEKISIEKFLKNSIKKRSINKDTDTEISYYLLKNAVKIMCQGDTLKEHGQIKVFAKLGSTEIEVGKLMVYQNDSIGEANLVVVNVITEYDNNNNKVIPQSHPSLDDIFNNQSFNQAMIKVKTKATEDFDLVELRNKTNDKDIIDFLYDIKDGTYMKSQREDPKDSQKTIESASDIKNRLIKIYEKFGKNIPADGKPIHDEKHHNTYLLFTNLNPTMSNGVAVGGEACGKMTSSHVMEWGNGLVIFQSGLKDRHIIIHEAAHTFTLPHTFETFSENDSANNKHIFYRGYTENVMDYFSLYRNKVVLFCFEIL
ncbi:hypothetical protein GASC598B02_006500, partial [Gilliamella apicola SCGC AB-598-B02]